MQLHERIKLFRERAGYTQKELAEIMGVSRGTVGHWELGTREPNVTTLRQLAQTLGITLATLLGEQEAEEDLAETLRRHGASEEDVRDILALLELRMRIRRSLQSD